MHEYERTILAFDEAGNEFFIDIFTSARNLSTLQHGGATGNAPSSFKTREGHAVDYLGGGEFAVRVPGEEDTLRVTTTDSEFA